MAVSFVVAGDPGAVAARAGVLRARGHAERAVWEATNGPGTFALTVEPFVDPGQAVRDAAQAAFEAARAEVEAAAHTCADGVRAGCAAAPEARNWAESGLAFLGGVLVGAGEAVWDLAQLVQRLQYGPVLDLVDLATGDLTVEELAAKKQLQVAQVQAMWTALTTDPVGFGKNVGKAVLDWDTWADDPARAVGHLVPDAVAAVATGGTATAATRGGCPVVGRASLEEVFSAVPRPAGVLPVPPPELPGFDWAGAAGGAATIDAAIRAQQLIDGLTAEEPGDPR